MEVKFNDKSLLKTSLDYTLMKGNEKLRHYKSAACHSSLWRMNIEHNAGEMNHLSVVNYREKQYIPYSEEGFIWWMLFMNSCGFPMTFEVGPVFEYTLEYKDYVSHSHFLSAITAARYIHYHYSTGYVEIPEKCYELMQLFPEWDSMEILLMANMIVEFKYGYFCHSHSICSKKVYGLITVKELEERAPKHTTVNEVCTKSVYFTAEELTEINVLAKNTDTESLLKLYNILKK